MQGNRGHIAALAIALDTLDDPFGAGDAAHFGIVAQVKGVPAGIEMVGIGQPRHRGVADPVHLAEPRLIGGQLMQRIIPQATLRAPRHTAPPIVMEGDIAEVHPRLAEGVQITRADRAPVDEFDPQLEGARSAAQEFVLVNPEDVIEADDLRDRRLTHADRADRLALDQFDGEALAQQPGKGGRRDPSGGAPADDHQLLHRSSVHAHAPAGRKKALMAALSITPLWRILPR